ncbi:MAG: DUF166 family (seleno)protein DfsP [Pseudomonadota bacterium]
MEKIIIFQQAGSGDAKIKGIRKYGSNLDITRIFDLPGGLPEFIDDPAPFFPDDFQADLVISFLKHPDLLDYLADLCRKKRIPLIASGKKSSKAITPVTCCSLGRLPGLGGYGELFGIPEYEVTLQDNKIIDLRVVRGASCGASWEVREKIIGLTTDQALECFAREVQYLCPTDPSNFDPVTGKSALHIAGNVHVNALEKAIRQAEDNR